jgi:(d)CTP diphosphatase
MTSNLDAPPTDLPPARRGVVAVILRDERLLVIRRSLSVVAPGAFCFPGGGIEAGETEPQALIREMQEELGVDVTPLRLIWRSVTPWRVDLAWWLTQLPADALLRPNPAEVASVHWHSAGEMRELAGLLESNHHFLAAYARGEFHFLS